MTHDLLQNVFDSLKEQIAVLDQSGTIVAVNETWRRFGQENGAPVKDGYLGRNYLEVCLAAAGERGEEAAACYQGLKAVLEAKCATFELEYPCDAPTQKRWFAMRANPLRNERGYVVVSHHAITLRKQVEAQVRQAAKVQSVLLQLTNKFLTGGVDQTVYQHLLEQAVELIPHAQAGSILVRQADERFHYLAALGFDLAGLRQVSLAEAELYFQALQLPTQASYVVRELDSLNLKKLDPERLNILRSAGATQKIKASLGVPIYVDGGVAGLLSLENLDAADAFTQRDQTIAEALGAQTGLVFQRLRTEAILRESEQRLRLHVEQTPLAVIEWDLDDTIRAWNPAAEHMFGYRQAEILNRRAPRSLVPASDRARVDAGWEALLARTGGYRSTNPNVTKDGRTITCDWYNTPLVNADDEVIGVTSLVQDITERVEAEERFHKAFQHAPVLTSISTVKDGALLEVNNTFCELTGYARDEVLGKKIAELGLIMTEHDRERLLGELQAERRLHDLEFQIRTKAGELRWLLGSLVLLEFGGETCALSMFLDVTERKRSEEQLSQAIQEVLEDSSWFGRAVMERLANLKAGAVSPGEVADLTEREREVLVLLAQGFDNAQIAARMGIGKATVRNYASRIYSKLNLKSRAEAVVWARERGLVL